MNYTISRKLSVIVAILIFICTCIFVVVWEKGNPTMEKKQGEPGAAPINQEGIGYPTLPAKLKVKTSVTLEVSNTSSKKLEYKWWTNFGNTVWIIAQDWGPDVTFSFLPDIPGSYAVQVDVRVPGNAVELQKKWLGQIQVTD